MDFGYACTSVLLENCSPNTGPTATRLQKVPDLDGRYLLLDRALEINLRNTLRLLEHTAEIGCRLYRMTSNLVPLATHPVATGWPWATRHAELLAAVGASARRLGLRLSTHPGAYTVLSSPRPEVVTAAVADLEFHAAMMRSMGLPDSRMVIHVGSGKDQKAAALERFARAFARLDPDIRRRLIVENDDVLFDPTDVLGLCRDLGIPMVLDVHHARVNPGPRPLTPALAADVFATWPAGEVPKIHLSSPRDEATPRAHADFVDPADCRRLIELVEDAPCAVMVEAKKKDQAVLKLWEDMG